MKRLFLFFLLIFICEGAIKKPKEISESPLITYRIPVITIPFLNETPLIDGKVEKREWYGASLLSPFISMTKGTISELSSKFYIFYTEEAIYFAFKFERPPYALNPLSRNEPFNVWQDDCIELFLRPVFGEKWEYNFVGNADSVYEEGLRKGVTDKSWKCKWEYKARRTDTGWEGEMKIPFSSLNLEKVKPKDVWEMEVVNNQKTPETNLSLWSFLKNWNATEDFGYLIFGKENLSVKVLNIGEISSEEIGAVIEITNFTDEEKEIEADIILYKPEREDIEYFKLVDSVANPLGPLAEVKEWIEAERVIPEVLKNYRIINEKKEEIKIPPKESRRINFSQKGERGNYLLYYFVKDKRENIILSSAPLPFFKRDPIEISITPYILSAQTIEVEIEYRKMKEIEDGDNVLVQLIKEGEDKPLRERRERVDIKNKRNVIDISVSGLSPGFYKVNVIIERNRRIIGERKENFNFEKIPEWWGNTYGYPEIKDIVPEPWTPIKKIENGFEVWNRKIKIGKLLQPEKIENGKKEMLLSPVKLEIDVDGIKFFEKKLLKAKNTEILYSQKFEGKNIEGEINLKGEFDGFMKYTLIINPKGNAEIKKIILEIPLDKNIVTHYHHGGIGTPSSYSELKITKGYGKLPENGLKLPFTDEIWLGNDEMGIEWCAETDRYWSLKNHSECVQVFKDGEKAILRINFVNKPITIEKQVKYEWAILPTPVKVMNKELLYNLRFAQGGFILDNSMKELHPETEKYIDALVEGGVNAYCQWAWEKNPFALWNEDFGVPGYRPTPLNEIRKEAFKKAIEIAHKKGIKWIVIYALWNLHDDWPDVGSYWKEQARYPLNPSFGGYLYCSQKAFADWYIYTLRKTIIETGIDGVFLDSSPDPHLCSNLHHGCGYIDDEGKVHGSYPVFANREFHKRIYYLFHGELKKNGLVYAHNSHFIFASVESFVDVHHCGEGSTLDRDILIPKFYGYPFGIPVSFTRWNNPVYPEKRMNSWRFVLQCDSTIKAHPSMVISKNLLPEEKQSYGKGPGREYYINLGYDENGEIVYKIWQLYKKFSFENSIWIPNWKIEKFVKVKDPDIWVCMHLNKGKEAIVVISSFKEEKFDGFIEFNWKEMGFEFPDFKIIDWIIDKEIKPEREGIKIDVKEKLFRVFYISKD